MFVSFSSEHNNLIQYSLFMKTILIDSVTYLESARMGTPAGRISYPMIVFTQEPKPSIETPAVIRTLLPKARGRTIPNEIYPFRRKRSSTFPANASVLLRMD